MTALSWFTLCLGLAACAYSIITEEKKVNPKETADEVVKIVLIALALLVGLFIGLSAR